MTPMTKETLLGFKTAFTVGDLKKWIEKFNVPDTAIIVTEVVDDKYFNGGIDISGMRSSGGILPEGSRSGEWRVYLKDREENEVRYHPIHSPINYNEDKEILFLDHHY